MKNILFTDAIKLNRPNAFHVMLKPAGPWCNLNCTYCYYLEKKNLYTSEREFRMSDELLEVYTKQFIEANQIPVVTFTWQGGEPRLIWFCCNASSILGLISGISFPDFVLNVMLGTHAMENVRNIGF